MSAAAPKRRASRRGWPWPVGPDMPGDLVAEGAWRDSVEVEVREAALKVERLAFELTLAVSRLEEARLDAQVANDVGALRQAESAIETARLG